MNAVVGGQLGVLHDDQKWRPVAGEFFRTLDEATARITERRDFVLTMSSKAAADHSFLPVVEEIARRKTRPDRPSVIRLSPMSDEEISAFRYDAKVLARL